MSAQSAKGNVGGSIFLGLFGLAFAGMGTAMMIGFWKQGHSGDGKSVWLGVGFCSIFAIIGYGIIFAAIKGFKSGKREAALAAQHPYQPWLLKKEWAEGRMVDSNKTTFFVVLAIALFWNAISWTATIGVFSDDSNAEEAAKYVVLLFPLIGLLLAWGAVYQLLRWRKFGDSTFEMAEVPGVIGGSLGGVVLTKVNVRPENGFHVILRNLKEVTTGSGKNRSTHTTVLWEGEQWVKEDALADDPTQSAIPIFFNIPYECQAPERVSNDVNIKWELKVKADVPGVDYEAVFNPPVFRTADSDPDFDASAARRAEYVAPPQPINWAQAGIIVSEDRSGGTRVETKAGRHFLFLIVPLLVGVGMLVGAYYAWNSTMPKLFPIVFAVFGLLITAGLGGSLFTSLRLTVLPDRIVSQRRYFGVSNESVVLVSELERLETASHMSSGETHFYDITAYRRDGSKVKLPLRIKGKARAEAMIRLIETKIGV